MDGQEPPAPADPPGPVPAPRLQVQPLVEADPLPPAATEPDDPFARAVLRELDARPAASRGPGLAAALGSYFAVLAISVGLLFAAGDAIVGPRVGEALILLIGVAWLALRGREGASLLGAPRLQLRAAALALGGTAVAFGLAQLLMMAVDTTDGDMAFAYRSAGLGLGVLLLDTAVLTPLAEELVFRGVVLDGLRSVWTERNAILGSAALFATIHLSPLSFAHLLVLGLVLGTVRVAGRSVWPCVLLHALYNTAVMVQAWYDAAPGP